MLLPLTALSLHRIQLPRIVEDARRRSLALHDGDSDWLGLLAEPIHRSMRDEHGDEIADRPVLQAVVLLVDDMMDALPGEGREPLREMVDDLFDGLALIKRTHGCIVQRTPTRVNNRSVN